MDPDYCVWKVVYNHDSRHPENPTFYEGVKCGECSGRNTICIEYIPRGSLEGRLTESDNPELRPNSRKEKGNAWKYKIR